MTVCRWHWVSEDELNGLDRPWDDYEAELREWEERVDMLYYDSFREEASNDDRLKDVKRRRRLLVFFIRKLLRFVDHYGDYSAGPDELIDSLVTALHDVPYPEPKNLRLKVDFTEAGIMWLRDNVKRLILWMRPTVETRNFVKYTVEKEW